MGGEAVESRRIKSRQIIVEPVVFGYGKQGLLVGHELIQFGAIVLAFGVDDSLKLGVRRPAVAIARLWLD